MDKLGEVVSLVIVKELVVIEIKGGSRLRDRMLINHWVVRSNKGILRLSCCRSLKDLRNVSGGMLLIHC
jgi:hypothetical protein